MSVKFERMYCMITWFGCCMTASSRMYASNMLLQAQILTDQLTHFDLLVHLAKIAHCLSNLSRKNACVYTCMYACIVCGYVCVKMFDADILILLHKQTLKVAVKTSTSVKRETAGPEMRRESRASRIKRAVQQAQRHLRTKMVHVKSAPVPSAEASAQAGSKLNTNPLEELGSDMLQDIKQLF
jgi:hypothetical protein